MRCLFGNCKSDRNVLNLKTQLLYSYCDRHRAYQSLRQKQRRRSGKLLCTEEAVEYALETIVEDPVEDPVGDPREDQSQIRSLEQQIAGYHKLFEEIDKIKHRLNALPESMVFTEKYVRDQLAAMVTGQIEYVLPTGDRIDVLTDTAIFEVKPPEQYKAAIGQLLVYGQFFPEHVKILYLTKLCTPRKLSTILHDCQRQGIYVQLFVE